MIDIDALEMLAKDAEWTGEWFYAGCNTVECRYPPSTHNYAGQVDEIAHPVPLNVAPFIAAANPAAILALIAEVRALREAIKRQASAARMGMDAAKAGGAIMLELATQARAESSPEVLASERAMNAMLTEECEALREDAERYRAIAGRCETVEFTTHPDTKEKWLFIAAKEGWRIGEPFVQSVHHIVDKFVPLAKESK